MLPVDYNKSLGQRGRVCQSVVTKGNKPLLCWLKCHPTSYPHLGDTQWFYLRKGVGWGEGWHRSRTSSWLCGDDDDRDGQQALATDHRTVIPSMLLLQSALLQSPCRAALFTVGSAHRKNNFVMENRNKVDHSGAIICISCEMTAWNVAVYNRLQRTMTTEIKLIQKHHKKKNGLIEM